MSLVACACLTVGDNPSVSICRCEVSLTVMGADGRVISAAASVEGGLDLGHMRDGLVSCRRSEGKFSAMTPHVVFVIDHAVNQASRAILRLLRGESRVPEIAVVEFACVIRDSVATLSGLC